MNTLTVKSYFRFVAFMLMLTTFLPVVSGNLPPGVRSHMLWMAVWFLSIVLLAPRVFNDRLFLFVLIFYLALVFLFMNMQWANIDEWDKEQAKTEMYYFVTAFALYAYFHEYKDYKGLAIILKWSLIFIAITAIMSIYSSIIDPFYARKIIGGLREEVEELQVFGGGTYGFVGALVCVFPFLVYYFRNNSSIPYSRLFILIFGILCFFALIRIQIFANILLAIWVFLFALLGRKRFKPSIVISAIVAIVIVLTPTHLYSNLFIMASDLFDPYSDVHAKLRDFSEYIKIGGFEGTSAGARAARYPLLWEAFQQDPILGYYNSSATFDITTGAHIYWMNKLTVYGIMLFIPFVLIFYSHIKRAMKRLDDEFAFYFLLSALAGIALGFMKALSGREFWYMMFFIAPSLYYLPLLKKQKFRNK